MSDLPINWSEVTLKDLIPSDGIFTDGDWVESKDQDPNGDVRLVQLADIGDGRFRDKSARFLTKAKSRELGCTYLKQNDILIARMPDPLGRACLFPLSGEEKYVTVVDVCIVRVSKETVSNRFLLYLINSAAIRQQIEGFESGTTRKRISGKNLAQIRIPLPPLNEQRRIVAKIEELFSELDKGIENLKQARAQLAAYRQSLLKHAFEGKLTADWRKTHAGQLESAGGIVERIQRERRCCWEQTQLAKFQQVGIEPPKNWREKFVPPTLPVTIDLPPLPSKWCWASLNQVFRVERGRFSFRPRNEPRFYGGEMPFVQIGNLPREGGIIREYQQTLNAEGISVSKKFAAGTVLIAIVGATIGNTGILGFESCCPDSLVALQSSSQPLLQYAEAFLRSKKYELRVAASASGGQPNINLDLLQPMAIPLPPEREMEVIVQMIESQLSQISSLESDIDTNLQKAEALRQSILKKAFAGELVPQDPNDEPAAELLARIRAEREAAANKPGKKSITRRNPVPGLKARHVKAQAEGLGKQAKKSRSPERAKRT